MQMEQTYLSILPFLFKDNEEFGIFDLKDINVLVNICSYIEEEHVPSDTEIISQTWKKSNKDGSRDKRFNGNYQIPVVKYGQVTFTSETGIDECYMFSNFAACFTFGNTYKQHFELLKTIK
jgi:hypothetical protein